MPEGRPAFVHDLGLALRIEILRDLAHDAGQLALPGLEQGRVFLDEIQQIFLWLGRKGSGRLGRIVVQVARQGSPQVVDLLLQMDLAIFQAHLLLGERSSVGALVAVDTMARERMAGIEHALDFDFAIALLAIGDEALGKDQVVDDRVGMRPGAKKIISLEKRVVSVAGMRNHQCLHRQGVFFHEVGNARIGIDHDLVGQAHVTAPIGLLGRQIVLAIGPVGIADRHAMR